jgi:predicted trehalose synthase
MTSRSTIPERVAEMHATLAAQPPSEAMGAFAREQAELAAGVAPARRVLPDADLVDVDGAATRPGIWNRPASTAVPPWHCRLPARRDVLRRGDAERAGA